MCSFYWPGHMNEDSIGEYYDALYARFNDWHSATFLGIWHLAIGMGLRSPGWAMAAAVLVLLAGLYLVLRARLSRGWALLGAAVVFAFPPVLGFDVVIGTDAWFAAAVLGSFGFTIRTARTEGWSRTVSAILAVALAFLAQAARPTALPVVVLAIGALALLVLSPRVSGWRRLAGSAALGAVGGLLLYGTNVVVDRLVLHSAQLHPEQATYKYDLVGLSVREHELLVPADVYPRQDLAYLAAHSNPATVTYIDPLLWGPYAAIPPIVEGAQLDSLQRSWLMAILRDPVDYVRFRLHTALWQLDVEGSPTDVYYRDAASVGYPPRFPALQAAAQAYVAIGTTSDAYSSATGGPMQRVWVYEIALLAIVVLGVRSRRRSDLVLALTAGALLLYSGEILVVGPIVTYRYMYPAIVTASALLFLVGADALSRGLARRAATAA